MIDGGPVCVGAKPVNHSNETLMEMMKRILRIRYFEEAIIDLKKKAEVPGGTHLCIGHEATLVGACMASGDNSYMTGSHRSHGHPIAKGGRLNQLMAELMARTAQAAAANLLQRLISDAQTPPCAGTEQHVLTHALQQADSLWTNLVYFGSLQE